MASLWQVGNNSTTVAGTALGWNNYKVVGKFTTPATGGVISALLAYLSNTGSGHAACNVKAVIYADSSGSPGALLATGTATAIANNAAVAWVTMNFASSVTLAASTVYWLGFIGDASCAGLGFAYSASGTANYNANTYTSGPSNPFGTPTASSHTYDIYAVGTVVTGTGAGATEIDGAESGATYVPVKATGAGAGAEQTAGAESGATLVKKAKTGAGAGGLEVSGTPQAVVRSFGTAVFGTGAVTVPKPAGLSLNDAITLYLFYTQGATPTFPAGFTTIFDDANPNADHNYSVAALVKAATAADVAGSGWAFSVTAGGTIAAVAGAFIDADIAGIQYTDRTGGFDGADVESNSPPLQTAVIVGVLTYDGLTGEMIDPQLNLHPEATWTTLVDTGTGNTGLKTSLAAYVSAPLDFSDEQGTDDWDLDCTVDYYGMPCGLIGLLIPAATGEAVKQAKTGTGAGVEQVTGAETGATTQHGPLDGVGAGGLEIVGLDLDIVAQPAAIPVAMSTPAVSAAVTPGVLPIYPGLPGYSSDADIILTRADGFTRHIQAEFENLVTARARNFGFETCTFELPAYLVDRWYAELAPFTHVQVVRNGITAFEGRITGPGVSIGEDDVRRKITARGQMDGFSDDEAVRACFADSDFSDWRRPTKTPKHDFNVDATTGNTGAIGAGYIEAQAKWGSTYAWDAWGDVCWWLYNGIPTTDKIAGIEFDWKWNGKLDPSLVLTDKLPVYNLFADPRGLGTSNPWACPKTGANVFATGDVDFVAKTAKTAGYFELATSGHAVLDTEGTPFANADACDFTYVDSSLTTDPNQHQGQSTWTHKMALPTDMKKALAAGDTVPLSIGWYISGQGLGLNADAGMVTFYDKNGVALGFEWVFAGLTDLTGAWAYYGTTIGAIPAGTASIEAFVEWQIRASDLSDIIYRSLCFPCVSNTPAVMYADGDTDGWEWTGTMNASASRQSDLTVTSDVLAQVKADFGGSPLMVSVFASDDPGNNQAPAQALMDIYSDNVRSGHFIGEVGNASALGVSIMVQGCPYTLQFKAPVGEATPDCYGLTISNYTVYATGGMASDGINVLGCIYDMAGRFCSEDQLDFPDPCSVTAKQLNYPQAMTTADIITALNALLEWEYGFREGGTFYCYSPARLSQDPRSIYQLPYSKTLAELLTPEIDDLCNAVEVSWTHADGITPGSVTAWRHSDWVPDTVLKCHHVDAPTEATYSDAIELANAYLGQHTVPEATGSLPLSVTSVLDLNGHSHDVLSMREGEYIRLTDQPPEERAYGDLLISRVTIDHQTLQATVEIGSNRKKLDCQLARLDAKIVRK